MRLNSDKNVQECDATEA